jgi:Protein of unknown function (DUF4240)
VNNDDFWTIVDQSLANSDGSVEDQTEHLRRLLDQLPNEVLVAFDAAFVVASRRLYSWQNWGAATVMLGGCGDDTFTDFRSWVISRGRQVYERFIDDPDTIVDAGLEDDEEIGLAEGFSYAASELFEERNDSEISEGIPDRETLEPEDAPAGERFDDQDDALATRYPRLAAAYLRDGGSLEEVRGGPSRLPSMPRHKDNSAPVPPEALPDTGLNHVQGPTQDEAPAAERSWITFGPFLDLKVSWGTHYGQKILWLVERVASDPQWIRWWATSNREELELFPFYSRSGKEISRVTVNKARVSVQLVFDSSRFHNVAPERLREQAIEDFESMIEAARSRLDLAAPPDLPTPRRKR